MTLAGLPPTLLLHIIMRHPQNACAHHLMPQSLVVTLPLPCVHVLAAAPEGASVRLWMT